MMILAGGMRPPPFKTTHPGSAWQPHPHVHPSCHVSWLFLLCCCVHLHYLSPLLKRAQKRNSTYKLNFVGPDKLIAILDWAILDSRLDNHSIDRILDWDKNYHDHYLFTVPTPSVTTHHHINTRRWQVAPRQTHSCILNLSSIGQLIGFAVMINTLLKLPATCRGCHRHRHL